MQSKLNRIGLFCVLWLGVLPPALAVRIATYNVENYNSTDRLVAGIFRKNYPKPEVAKAELRAEIRVVDADVLALQEMGGEDYARELQLDLRREGLDYPYVIVLNAEDKNRKLAIFSKNGGCVSFKRMGLNFQYLGATTSIKRGLLGVVFQDAMGEWAVFNVHLKGKFTDRSEDPYSNERRLLEARVIRDAVADLFPPRKGDAHSLWAI